MGTLAHGRPPIAATETRPGSPSVSTLGIAVVVLVGALLTALYAYATYRIPLHEFFPEAGISLDWIKMLGPERRFPAVAYLVMVFASSAGYAAALAAFWYWRDRVPRWVWFAFPVLFAIALLLMYPPTAVDMFHYHADARTLWIHRLNPLVVPPSETAYHIGISWADKPSPYGPIWSLLTGLLAPLMIWGDHGLATLIGLKVIAAASLFGCAWLIYLIVRKVRPGDELLAFVLFAWNPFVLLRVVGNGHNDLVMMFFALLALYFAYRREWTLMLVALAVSVMVKYTMALIGPPLLLYAWTQIGGSPRYRAQVLAGPVLWAAAVVVFSFVPFWSGLETLDSVRGQTELAVTSLVDITRTFWEEEIGADAAIQRASLLAALLFIGLAIPITWQARRGYNALLAVCFSITFLYLVIAAGWFRPWYMLWPAALVLLHPRRWNVALFLAITFANLFPDIIEQYRYDWGVETVLQARTWPVLAQFVLPVLVFLGWLVAYPRSSPPSDAAFEVAAGPAPAPPAEDEAPEAPRAEEPRAEEPFPDEGRLVPLEPRPADAGVGDSRETGAPAPDAS